MKHYFFGGGEAVNLGDVGLGTDFENTAQVGQAIGIAEGKLAMDLRTGGNGSVSGRVPLGGVGNGKIQNNLYSLGSGSLQYSSSCTGGSCSVNFSYRDFFTDPLNFEDGPLGRPVDLPFSKPYGINYRFRRELNF